MTGVGLSWSAHADPPGIERPLLLSLAAPALMYVILTRLTGVPYLEAHMARSRGQAWIQIRIWIRIWIRGRGGLLGGGWCSRRSAAR